MKGLVLVAKNEVKWMDVKEPVIKSPFDAIVRTEVVSPCSGDSHVIETASYPALFGKILGHEGVGIIEEVGSQVKDFKAGDRVILPTVPVKWRSLMAQNGIGKLDMESPFTSENPDYNGFFTEKVLVFDADMNLGHIPDDVTMEQASMVPDVMATGFSAAEAAGIKFGDTVLILGIGPIGLMALRGSVLKGAARTIGVGARPVTFELAKKMGATDLINYKDGDIVEQVFDLTNGKPVDKVIIGSGGNASDAFSAALTLVRFGGVVTCFAGFLYDEKVTLPNAQWNFGAWDKTIKTVQSEGGRVFLERLLALVSIGRVDPGVLVSHKFDGLDKIEEALHLMASRDQTVLKPIVYTQRG